MNKNTILTTLSVLCIGFATQAQTFEWAKSFEGSGNGYGNSITVDAAGNIYTIGMFGGSTDFDPSSGTYNLTPAGSNDIYVQKLDPSGNFLWAKSFGGTGSEEGRSISVDDAGNVYTTGFFYGTVDFNPGPGTYSLTSTQWDDAFVQKLDASGNFIWAKSFGGTNYDEGNSITVDASGNVYTTGYFQGTVDFDPGSGTYNLSSNGSDIFVQKMDASGNFLWAKSFGGTNSDEGISITVDASGNIYTTGTFRGTADFDPGSGTYNLISNGDTDVFVLKLDASGNLLWVNSFGGTGFDRGYSIEVNATGNVYTTGYFEETVDFDPDSDIYNLTSNGSIDVFVQKLGISGNFLWAKSFGGSLGGDIGKSITVDATGNVYTTGQFQGTVDFNPGSGTYNFTSNGVQDVFVQKLDNSGNFLWTKSFGGSSGGDIGNSIIVDGTDNIYTTGNFAGIVDFNPGSGTYNLTSAGGSDVFVHKFSDSNIGIIENNLSNDIVVYPNPTTREINIDLKEVYNELTLKLSNVVGQIVYTSSVKGQQHITVPIESGSGIYFLELSNNRGKKSIIKVIKN